MTESVVHLDLFITAEKGYPRTEMIFIPGADVADLRLADTSIVRGDRNSFWTDVVMRDGRRYTVRGSMHEVADKIWPSPQKCPSCRRPL